MPEAEGRTFSQNLVDKPVCRLPCIFGLTPGETTLNDGYQYLARFSWRLEDTGIVWIQENEKTHWVNSYYIDFFKDVTSDGLSFGVKDGMINNIYTGSYKGRSNFLLSALLSDYGKPDQIYIHTFESVPSPPIPFVIGLFYESQHILAFYEYTARNKGEYIEACPQPVGPGLLSFSSDDKWPFARIQSTIIGSDLTNPLSPLEKVTNLSINTFYDIYRDGQTSECIKTDTKYWK
jgi:hypothetical protein